MPYATLSDKHLVADQKKRVIRTLLLHTLGNMLISVR